jgi:GNAT superfamily N-acetyltransferase
MRDDQLIGFPSVREIGDLQERAARAVPAAVEENKDGCWLRYSDCASTWWAGATLLHGNARSRPLARRIEAAEAFYAAHGVPARFQLCPACPPGLDAALAHRGYGLYSVISLQVATTSTIADGVTARSLHVDLNDQLNEQWFELLMAAQGTDLDPAPEWRLLRRVDGRSAYATASVFDHPVAVGRAVVDTGWVGVFNMATLPAARRKGAASAVLVALAEWAISQGLEHMYLHADWTNAAALNLYRGAGFEQLCTYHYRTAAPRALTIASRAGDTCE